MSLPPGFLEELRARVPLSRVVGRKVAWDNRKSRPQKGDMWAPCPFHQERSASFHVDDAKGFYYCFGCHAKGDAISFLRETGNMGFMEAVAELAREAGMAMPAADPRAAERADRRSVLVAAMEAAVRFYRMQLSTSRAGTARDYLAGRGLDAAALERFEIGFAPDDRQALLAHLRGAGVDEAAIVEAGLAARPDDGGALFDRFRGRIVFPIRDARGRCIAFGGRALSATARAKYLNSPETPLFDKGRCLYNHGPARGAVGSGAPLIVVEGYMDVIALVSGGFEGAVAPLGTAITEEQLRMLWQMAPEPVIALDGDAAGLRAAQRLIDLALPLIEAGQGLRFALMPAGEDPDDVLRAGGPAAMAALLDRARPMAELLWERETEGCVLDSPERRAALDKTLRAVLRRISDTSIRAHYAEDFRARRSALMAPPPRPRPGRPDSSSGRGWRTRPGGWQSAAAAPPLAATRSSLLARPAGTDTAQQLRESVLLAALLVHPVLLAEFEDDLETFDVVEPDHERLRLSMLRNLPFADDPEGWRTRLDADGAGAVVARLLATQGVTDAPIVRPGCPIETVRLSLRDAFARHRAHQTHPRVLAEAEADITGLADEGLTWRLAEAAGALNRPGAGFDDDASDLGENTAELRRKLDEAARVRNPRKG